MRVCSDFGSFVMYFVRLYIQKTISVTINRPFRYTHRPDIINCPMVSFAMWLRRDR